MNALVTSHKHFDFGQAPFRFVGIWSAPSPSLAEANPEAYNGALRGRPDCCHFTCDHCGMPIVHHHIIKDSQGQRFAVGSECIAKAGSVELVTESQRAEKIRQREIRQAKANEKREARRQKHESELQRQRDVNGGLTDWELKQANQLEAARQHKAKCATIVAPIVTRLRDGKGGFCDSVSNDMERGQIPTGRGRDIVLNILAKQAGRANSKAYDQEYESVEKLLDEIELQLGAI